MKANKIWHDCWEEKPKNGKKFVIKGNKWAYKDDLFNLQEEPVSEDLEKEMNYFFLTMQVQDKEYINEDTFRSIARHFAAWQKQQLMAKAVDVEVKVDAGGYPYIPQIELYDYVEDIPFAKEGDKYKVILIKEE